MSELRIALVAEGPTDAIIIESALKAILSSSFVLISLQPEPTRPGMGSGWGGVLKWCREFRVRGAESLEDDPALEHFDLVNHAHEVPLVLLVVQLLHSGLEISSWNLLAARTHIFDLSSSFW